MQESFGF